MKNAKLAGAAATLCVVGGTVLALYGVSDSITKSHPQLGHALSMLLIPGGVLSAIGVLMYIASFVIAVGDPIQGNLKTRLFRDRFLPISARCAKVSDLEKLQSLYVDQFGNDVPSVELMKRWLNRCPTAFTLIYTEDKKSDLSVELRLAGSFKILPLNAAGLDALERGQTSGSRFDAEHLSAGDEPVAAYYVGDLFALFADGKVIQALDSKCLELAKGGVPIYARAFTDRGRTVMESRGFVHVADGKSKLELRKLSRLHPPTDPDGISTIRKRRQNRH